MSSMNATPRLTFADRPSPKAWPAFDTTRCEGDEEIKQKYLDGFPARIWNGAAQPPLLGAEKPPRISKWQLSRECIDENDGGLRSLLPRLSRLASRM